MLTATRGERIFFGVMFLSAVWIGLVGFFLPEQFASIFTWLPLPPLHARFLGALYLFGALFMLACLLAKEWTQVQAALITAAIWTGLIFIVSLFYLNKFDLGSFSSWLWLVSYFVYPVVALWLAYRRAQMPHPARADVAARGWQYQFLLAQGIVVSVFALALLLLPGVMTSLWPWKITEQFAQFYAGPLLAYGYSSIQFARAGTGADLRILLPPMIVFTVGVLLASLIHFNLFSLGEIGDLLWFAAFAVATGFLGLIIYRSMSARDVAASAPARVQ